MQAMRILIRGTIVSAAVLALALGLAIAAEKSSGTWTQWGGPSQEFRAESTGLAKEWSAEGPERLWSRELGEGYSAILVEDGRLYTMYRDDEKEAVVCLNAKNGKTIWEHKYAASPKEGHVEQFGAGPRATPLIVGEMIYTVGVSGKMHALKKANGKPVWSHDLWEDFGGNFLNHGYSSSPMVYRDTVITLVGGEGQSIVAFDQKDGSVKWKALSFKNSYSTPRVLNVDGKPQLIAFMAEEAIGVDPDTGELEWSVPHQNQWGQNISMPVMSDPNHLLISSPQAGAKGLKLTREGGETKVEELWSTRKIQFYHVNTVRDGEWVYGSTGTMTPAFMASINIKSGEIGWRKRGFSKANCVMADGRLYVLDEDGKLALTTATPEDLVVHSEVEMLDKVSWTVPTIAGKTMYVRDKTSIVALNLG
jgi:outer membrane protein assembly factor BamB